MTRRLIIRNGSFVNSYLPSQGDLLIEDEKIVGVVSTNTEVWPDAEVIDATGKFVLPGLVDPHTHIQLDTGIYKTDDDWDIGTKVAAYGGVTTVIDFATQFPNMTFQEALEHRLKEAQPAHIDYSFHMIITTLPDQYDRALFQQEMAALVQQGITSVKLFTTYRPNYYIDDDALLSIFQLFPPSMVVMVHCENDAMVSAATQRLVQQGQTALSNHAKARPPEAEYEAAARIITLANLVDNSITPYIVHCSWSKTFELLQTLRTFTDQFYIETCPQYFWLDDSLYLTENAAHYIMQPPLRPAEDVKELQFQLPSFDVVATDHCDYHIEQKLAHQDFTKTPGGITGLETSLQLTFTLYKQLLQKAPLSFGEFWGSTPLTSLDDRIILGRIAKQMAEMPAKIFGIFPQKGALMPNSDADVVIFDPKPTLTLKADELHHIGGYSPYNNYAVYGKIETTICRGQILVHRGKFVGDIGRGRFVKGVLSK